MDAPDYIAAINYAIQILTQNLPGELFYHSLEHTLSDVLPAVERLADLTGVDPTEKALLRVAAAYHDTGYAFIRKNHELASIRLAAQELPGFGLEDLQIEQILGIILATRLPNSPRNLLEEIMVDADMDNLGREDFFERGNALRRELAIYGQFYSDQEWIRNQLSFLEQHRYFTEAARNLRESQKQQHIQILKTML